MAASQMIPTHVAHYTATNLKPPHHPFTPSESQTIYTPDIVNEYAPTTSPIGGTYSTQKLLPALSSPAASAAQSQVPNHAASHTSTYFGTDTTPHSPLAATGTSSLTQPTQSSIVARTYSPTAPTTYSPAANVTSSPMATTALSPAASAAPSFYRTSSLVSHAPSEWVMTNGTDVTPSLNHSAPSPIRSPNAPVPGTHYIPPLCEYVPPHKLQPGIQPSYSPYRVPVFVERPIFDLGRPGQKPKTKVPADRSSSSESTSTTISNGGTTPHHHQHSGVRSPHSHIPVIRDRGVPHHESVSHHPLASNIFVESEAQALEPSLEWDYQKPRRRACC